MKKYEINLLWGPNNTQSIVWAYLGVDMVVEDGKKMALSRVAQWYIWWDSRSEHRKHNRLILKPKRHRLGLFGCWRSRGEWWKAALSRWRLVEVVCWWETPGRDFWSNLFFCLTTMTRLLLQMEASSVFVSPRLRAFGWEQIYIYIIDPERTPRDKYSNEE